MLANILLLTATIIKQQQQIIKLQYKLHNIYNLSNGQTIERDTDINKEIIREREEVHSRPR